MPSFWRNTYSPLPTNHVQGQQRRRISPGLAILTIAACTVLLWAGRQFLASKKYSPLTDYQELNAPSLLGGPSAPREQRAVVSTLYSDSYAIGVAVLGHSVRHANVTARLVLPYLEGRVSDEALCVVRAVGWEPLAVPFIPPPHNGEGIYYRFYDQYTKLNIWGLDAHGITQAVYLDADTLAMQNFDELFELPFTFAAVPDIYGDARGFTVDFNAGVLVLRPAARVLAAMKAALEVAKYPLAQAEQSFLNLFFGASTLRLPYAYNANLAIKRSAPAMWAGMRDEIRIVHYTLTKPFIDDHAEQGTPRVLDEGHLRQVLEQAATAEGGLFAEEVGWWSDAYDRMMSEARTKIKDCQYSHGAWR
ncbi:hypothetical protein H0H81_000055 [Sphagnurus paluster]|uniref:Glycosyltransferase family 8 protein n=1 Tax=Sphagnurus paluster TaxID=117069 RepID=A0A9P7G2P1_9AGAR|nr:hypothetical protein H0H81_000055 [Sphagnurus paluster]